MSYAKKNSNKINFLENTKTPHWPDSDRTGGILTKFVTDV